MLPSFRIRCTSSTEAPACRYVERFEASGLHN
jgi:hypothetical protein